MKMLASINCPACYIDLQNISFLLFGNGVSLKLKAWVWRIFNPASTSTSTLLNQDDVFQRYLDTAMISVQRLKIASRIKLMK